MTTGFNGWCRSLAATLLLLAGFPAHPALIEFMGPLNLVVSDEGSGRYTALPVSTVFDGAIDDATFSGLITDGVTRTDFGCCLAANGLGISSDLELDASLAAPLNAASGSNLFTVGQVLDLVDIEGDVATPGGGRIEIGLSQVLSGDAFDSEDPGQYSFDPANLLGTLFFIQENDSAGDEIDNGIGLVTAVPLPATGLFAVTALLAAAAAGRRRR